MAPPSSAVPVVSLVLVVPLPLLESLPLLTWVLLVIAASAASAHEMAVLLVSPQLLETWEFLATFQLSLIPPATFVQRMLPPSSSSSSSTSSLLHFSFCFAS